MMNKKWTEVRGKLHWATIAVLVVFVALGLASKSTPAPAVATQPAPLDINGINKIAIHSIAYSLKKGRDIDHFRDFISQRLTAAGKTVATWDELSEWEAWWKMRQAMQKLADYQATAAAISSDDLAGAYQANAVRGDQLYANKLLKVSGTVSEIQQDSTGNYFVRLSAGKDSVIVYFLPSEDIRQDTTTVFDARSREGKDFLSSELNRLISVEKGQTITVVGTCYGRNLPDMEDTAEILRLLGAGDRVNVGKATFPVELKDYPGTVDAVITVDIDPQRVTDYVDTDGNKHYRTVGWDITYKIMGTRDGSLMGDWEKQVRLDSNKKPFISPPPDDPSFLEAKLDQALNEIPAN